MLDRSTHHSGEEALARAKAILPVIAGAAGETEKGRRVTPAVMAALHEARLMRMLIPRSLGGLELDPLDFVKVVEEIASADASTAWCVGQGSGCSFTAAFLDPAIAREVFGPADAVLAWGPSNRNARAVACEGGYRVSGKWVFASGNRNAQWLAGHCSVYEADGSPRLGANGKSVERSFLFRRDVAQIEDVWDVMGLRGTGSDNYSVDNLFVPDAFGFGRDNLPDRRENGLLYRFSVINMYGFAFAAVALGVARQMLADFIELAGRKTPNAGGALLRDSGAIQQQTGTNFAKLEAMRAYLHSTIAQMQEHAATGEEFTVRQRIISRMMSTLVIQSAKEVGEFAYQTAGATAIFTNQAFERRFRDIHAVTQQGQGHVSNFDGAGQMLLGLDAVPRR